jgi:hypothetical protein
VIHWDRKDGVWEYFEQRVITKRTQFKSLQDDTGIFLPEIAYAEIGESNVTRRFEDELKQLLGIIPRMISHELSNNSCCICWGFLSKLIH